MANSKIVDFDADTSPDTSDLVVTVDVDDPTDDATGTNKKVTLTNLLRYPETFDSTDLDGNGDITITHGKGYRYPQVTVVDSNHVRVDGYKVTYDSTTALTLRIEGAGVFTGWRVEIV